MKRVLQYIFQEVKEGRLSKPNALELAKEICTQGAPVGHGELHPLLQRNTSDLSGQRFFTHLSEDEPCLRVMNGSRVLPDVAHLEMARAAVKAAAGEDVQAEVYLEQVEWLSPVVVGPEGLDLHVELFAEDDGRTSYEIYSIDEAEESLIYSHGCVVADMGEAAVENWQAAAVKASRSKCAPIIAPAQESDLLAPVQASLIEELSKLTKMEIDAIDIDCELGEYGFDSISFTALSHRLNELFGLDLLPTIFFEHRTLGEFARYLVEHHREVFAARFAPAERVGIEAEAHEEEAEPEQARPRPQYQWRTARPAPRTSEVRTEAVGFEGIAVIGMSGRFPMAEDVSALWRNLVEGRDCIVEIPRERWDWEAVYGDPQEANKTNIKWGGFIDGVGEFDPLFFGISPREAELMDPQQRLLMSYIWKAIEDAGYAASRLAGSRTAILVGIGSSGYGRLIAQSGVGNSATGMMPSIGPNRMSYFLDLHGPSEPIETACSSSLVAVHRAIQALSGDNCELAIAGGVNTLVIADGHIALNKGGMLSVDGRCKAFSRHANGYVRGEGVGMVVLKKLSAAERDGDHIYGVIRGSSENHGGRAQSLTAPNPKAQAELLKAAYGRAGIDPRTVSYIEAHGTGTELGDPIEINGLKSAFRDLCEASGGSQVAQGYCGLGTVKSNIGHLELAAGVAGLIKVLLQLKHKTLAKSLHAEELNPYIRLEDSPFYVVGETQAWRPLQDEQGRALPRRAGVSSFGFGGVNAHVVIEEYVPRLEAARPLIAVSPSHPALVVLSAKNAERLKDRIEQLVAALEGDELAEADLADIAYTLQVGRDAMESRLAVLAGSPAELVSKLRDHLADKEGIAELYRGEVRREKETLSVLAADEDMAQTIEAWIAKGKYGKLLELWVKGWSLDWQRLYGEAKPRRIPLPSYPFAKERYWVEPAAGSAAASVATIADGAANLATAAPAREVPGRPARAAEAFELLTFEEVWEERTLAALSGAPPRRLVCLLSDAHNRRDVAAWVKQRSPQTEVVFVAQAGAEAGGLEAAGLEAGCYMVSRGDGLSYWEAMRQIRAAHGEVDAVLYLWGLEDAGCLQDTAIVMHLLQALSWSGLACARLLLAGACGEGLERCHLESWIGFERSLGLVWPQTRVAVIGQERGDGVAVEQWLPRLWDEVRSAQVESAFYRGGRREVCQVRQRALEQSASILRGGGSYVISGGCGGLGLLVAQHLARTRSANLVLLGRSGLDEAKQQAIASLEQLGSRVMYVQADVCDRAALEEGLRAAEARFGALHGLVHAAGVVGGGTVFEKEAWRFDAVLAPKIAGTLALDEAIGDRALDFVCYFSSSAALLGDFGACDYAIANRFLMAHAHHRNQRQGRGECSGKTVSISWGLWQDGGMGVGGNEQTHMYLKSSGQRALGAVEGVAMFERLLGQAGGQHLVLAGQPSRVRRFLGLETSASAGSIAVFEAPATSRGSGGRAELKGLSVAQCVSFDLTGQVSELVKLPRERLDAQENLAEFGLDSIGLAELARRLKQHYAVEISPSVFFSYPTLAQLTGYFVEKHAAAVEALYRKAQQEVAAVVPQLQLEAPPLQPQLPRNEHPAAVPPGAGVPEPIAIIGMSGRFPKARNVEELWRILANGEDAVEEIPPDRFDWRRIYGDPLEDAGKTDCKWGGFVPEVGEFDPLFFEISPREAALMDPRQRLLLMEAWRALEAAGYGPIQLGSGKVGMFVGAEQGDYQLLTRGSGSITANHDGILASRLAYFLNMRGPAMAINTACSSGLVALHQACVSLRNGECDTALAAAVNLMLTPMVHVGTGQAGMLSKDGKCHAFDSSANGMVPGEAVAVVVLKLLAQAEADGDPILAVIRGSGINYDGKTNGITAPSGASQASLLKEVYDRHGVDVEEIGYIVAHGTGTRLGDPIEVNALSEAFKDYTSRQGFCALTSSKTNFGHTLAASGLVSLIGLVQSLRHQTIPASLHCAQENDYIDWRASPFYVNKASKPWPEKADGKPRLGAVSAFGMSGTNAHVVVESYRARQPAADSAHQAPCYLLVVSAKTEAALQGRIADLIAVLEQPDWSANELPAMSHTLLCGRQHFSHRCALVAEDREAALYGLKQALGRERTANLFAAHVARHFTPQKALQSYGNELLSRCDGLRDDAATCQDTLRALADLYCQGYELAWQTLHQAAQPNRIPLPTYPFAKERYWVEASAAVAEAEASDAGDAMDDVASDEAELERPGQGEEGDCYRGGRAELKGLSVGECVTWDLSAHVSELLKLPRDRLAEDENLADFGFDSIGLAELGRRLSRHYGVEISPSLFFSHPTLAQLTQYFVGGHPAVVEALYREQAAPSDGPFVREAKRKRVPQSKRLQKPSIAVAGSGVPEPIAIIGMSGRFPKARNVDELWRILANGEDAVEEIPPDRFDWRRYYSDPLKEANKTDCKWGGFVPGVGEFDPLFFEISPREAELMDPRQRLLLMEAWRALEDAGYGPIQLGSGKVGMFVGVEQGDYQLLTRGSGSITSSHDGILASRLAYFLNMRGPTMAINTACSSGLVALHQACLSLRSLECDTALAAGANLMLTPHGYIGTSQAGMLSKDGKCHAFDSSANGMVPGEAVAVVVLKRLSQAQADGDPILAVIRGSGINYDGKTNGITAPSGASQASLLKEVYDRHAVEVEEIGYIVAHGTGTRLGDPIEVNALSDAFRPYTQRQGFCALTSSKTNFGHTLAASGLVSLIGLVQSLRHETIPASLHCTQENDYIDWRASPFYVNKASKAWPEKADGKPRLGAVSAFGMSGTNAHVVVESYRTAVAGAATAPCYLLALSARTEAALQSRIEDLIAALERQEWLGPDLLAMSHTLLCGRQHFSHRFAVVAEDRDAALYGLRQAGQRQPNLFHGTVVRNFAGQKALQSYGNELLTRCETLLNEPASYQETLRALAELYCQGYDLVWPTLHRSAGPRRIPLPTYPFARQRYWVEQTAISAPVPGEAENERVDVYEPEMESIAAVLQSDETQLVPGDPPEGRADLQAMDELIGRLLWTQLIAAGFPIHGKTNVPVIRSGLGLRDRYDRWLEESLRALVGRGYVAADGESYAAIADGVRSAEAGWAEWEAHKDIWLADSAVAAQVNLVETTLRALPGILAGQVRATDVMFPNGSLALVEGIYRNTPVADYFNDAVAGLVERFIEERLKQDASARIRILEVGAGTGGTSVRVLARLKAYEPHVEEYRYTDISQAFLLHAQEAYGPEHPYLQCGIFDVEKPVAAQGIEGGSYDLVIATNVLHATRNIRRTMQNAKAALRSNGMVLLNEISGKSLFTHLTFGLLEGWWLYEDEELRIPGCPGLSPEGWQQVLDQEGFRTIFFPLAHAHARGQQIVAAESDGVVRQPRAATRSVRVTSGNRAPAGLSVVSTQPVEETGDLLRQIQSELLGAVSALIKLKVEAIDIDCELGEYGFDSISFTALSHRLNELFGLDLQPTIFFEHRTLGEFARYLVEHHREVFASRFAPAERVGAARAGDVEKVEEVRPQRQRRTARPAPRTSEVRTEAVGFEGIAVIGMSGRFPMAEDVSALWRNLVEGRDCIVEIPRERWDWEAVYGDPQEANKTNIKWGGFIDGVGEFDPLFFGISPREAELMDPQQRLLMSYVWKAIEDSGYAASQLAGSRTAILVGMAGSGYGSLMARASGINSHTVTGLMSSIGPNRMSYFLDLHGPSEPIETACSSSLVAVHRAIQALSSDSCELAIAGGVNTLLIADGFIALNKAGMLSVDGRCKAFSRHANGYVRGEGVGMVVLKKLSAAERDGDHIYGVIRGSAENHGGRSQSLTAPNPKAQAELIRSAFERAGIDPRTVSYIETHGTGTELGDPIEINGLKSAFNALVKADGGPGTAQAYCGLGAIKSNVGHLEFAAGIAGLIKVLLQLKHRTLAKSLHAEELNPYIRLEDSPFYVVGETQAWQPLRDGQGRELPRRAGLSSFGAGGVNAHVVIEEYVPRVEAARPLIGVRVSHPALVVLSAKNAERLKDRIEQLVAALEGDELAEADLADIAYTLQVGRDAMESRLAVLAGSPAELVSKLRDHLADKEGIAELYRGDVRREKETLSVLAADEDMAQTIEAWIAKGKYGKLLELWVKGWSLDWQRLYAEVKPRRIPLPSYPFAKERYWVEPAAGSAAASVATIADGAANPAEAAAPARGAARRAAAVAEAFELLTFEEVWEERALAVGSGDPPRRLVCLLSDAHNRRDVAAWVKQRSPQTEVVFVAEAGAEAGGLEAGCYMVSRGDGLSYWEAMRQIRAAHGEVDAVLYLWGLEDAGCLQDTAIVMHLLQALASSGLPCGRLLLAGACGEGIERCHLESWIGFERSLGLVWPQTRVAVIGQERGDGVAVEQWLPRLWDEVRSGQVESAFYRGGRREVCQVRQRALEQSASVLRGGGSYVISGGCGGLGLLVAQHLARTRSANLVLLGRSGLDEAKQQAIASLEQLGSRVMYVQADVCDRAALEEGLRAAEARFGALHGLVHAAGVVGGGTVFEKEAWRFDAVLAPKIAGTLALDEAIGDRALDFVCYFSSSAALLGDFGACDYAIANRFLMAHAHHRNERQGRGECSGKTVSISWGLWQDGGMGVGGNAQTHMYLKSSGQRALGAVEGVAMFERLLGQAGGQHLVLAGQPSRVRRFLGLETSASAGSIAVFEAPATSRGGGGRAELKGLSVAQCVSFDLTGQVSELVKLPRERLDAQENLAEFGLDSIGLAELARRLKQHYAVEISPSVFFSYPTLAQLTGYFVEKHAAAVEALYRKAQQEVAAVVPQLQLEAPPLQPQLPRNEHPAAVPPGAGVPEAVAIIGMSGRFPKARTVDELWRILANGEDAVEEIPPDRFDWRRIYGDPLEDAGKTDCKWGGFVPEVGEFDPLFFEISPREAALMDPRQRLLLMEAWRALEAAGYGPIQLGSGKVGMFVGAEQGDYQLLTRGSGSITANHDGILASRLAYFLNMRGPAMAINTACSSGLVALHQACVSLRNGECDTALAAAVNLMLTPMVHVGTGQAGMLSKDGKCHAFDSSANGMVPGEAVAVVVLKLLAQAEADGDPILAVIRGSGINYDGKTNGITAPSGASQASLLKEVYDRHGVDVEEIGYIVAHGTGTRLGDPIEVNALSEAFKDYTSRQGFCALTSSKTNFGHTLAASGLVSLIGLVQSLRHQTIPASLHCAQENDYIDWRASPFYVNKASKPWPEKADGKPRLGAVSAFGMSGTNAHVVVESYRARQPATDPSHQAPCYLLVVSAKTEAALQGRIADLIAVLEQPDWSANELPAMSHTLLCGRQHFSHRCALVAEDREAALYGLRQALGRERTANLFAAHVARHFTPQKALQSYGNELLSRCHGLRDDAATCQDTLRALADLYCQGYELAWQTLHQAAKPNRIPLPTYPFAKERYWVEAAARQAAAPAIGTDAPASYSPLRRNGANHTTPSGDPATDVQATLIQWMSQLLDVPPRDLDVATELAQYGLDSISSVQLVNRVNKAYGLELPPTIIHEHPTLAGLAHHLVERYGDELIAGRGLADREGVRHGPDDAAEPDIAPPHPIADHDSFKRAAAANGSYVPFVNGSSWKPLERSQADIRRRSRPASLPLSCAQQRMLLTHRKEAVGPAYHLYMTLKLSGPFDGMALQASFTEVVRRHESLRTRFATGEDGDVQVVEPSFAVELPVFDLDDLDDSERSDAARRLAEECLHHAFDLGSAPLFRARLIRLRSTEHMLVIVVHHIISDGWSMEVLVREIGTLYTAFAQGRPSPLTDLQVQYADHAVWQRELVRERLLEEQLGYWTDRLAGAPVLNLPTDRPRPPAASYRGSTASFSLPEQDVSALRHVARQEGATLFMVLLAAFNIVVSRLSGQKDVVIGTSVAGRGALDLEDAIGFFINLLALRTDLSGEPTFRELLGRVKETTLGALAHQDLPFAEIEAAIGPTRDLAREPLFRILFGLQKVSPDPVEFFRLDVSRRPVISNNSSRRDQSFFVYETADGLFGLLEYATDIFEASTIDGILREFKATLYRIIADPDFRISSAAPVDRANFGRALAGGHTTSGGLGSLDPADWNGFRAQGHRMLDDIVDYLEHIRERPVWQPIPGDVRARFREPLPVGPTDLALVHDEFMQSVLPFSTGNSHPGFMGWVHGGGNPAGMLAEMLAAGLNANLGGRDHMPVEVERQIVHWARELFGFPERATGLFVTGTSMANMIALLVARRAAMGDPVRRAGLSGDGCKLTAYTSAAAHGCIAQAMDIAGIGTDALRLIPTDQRHMIDVAALELAIAEDRRRGLRPFLIIGTAGTVDIGAIDDLKALAALARREAIWFHVDGAFGALGMLVPEIAPRLAGMEEADSLAFDFHKWGQVPYDAGFILVRDGAQHRAAFTSPAAYLRRETRGVAGGSPWFCDFGPDLSRGFRALKTWFTIKVHGTEQIGAAISRTCHLAQYMSRQIEASPELELLAPVQLNIVCFRYLCDDADAINAAIVLDLHESGIAVPSTTILDGKLAIRAAIVNHRTEMRDIDAALQAILRYGRARAGERSGPEIARLAGESSMKNGQASDPVPEKAARGRGALPEIATIGEDSLQS